MNNPLLEDFNLDFGAIPFDKIKREHFLPGIKKGIDIANSKIQKIINNRDKPNFKNVIEAIEESTFIMNRASSIYYNLYYMHSDGKLKELAEEIAPLMAGFESDLFTNSELFKKVESVYKNRDKFNLSDEEFRLLDKEYTSFKRNGALLNNEDKEKLKKIDEELSTLSPKFGKNELDATNEFFIHLTKEDEVRGIPDNALSLASKTAKDRGFENGWVFTLQMPSYIPVIRYAGNRELREKLSKAYGVKNLEGKFDNREIILRTVKLRDERARLLGYDNHSHYVLEDRMAQKPERVMDFLDNLFKVANPAAKKELEEVRALARDLDGIEELQSWDMPYYSQKLKQKKFDFDPEVLRPYLKSENVIEGVFNVASKLYGLRFNEINSVPLYHEDVKCYEVIDGDRHMGLLYIDLYPRETKQSGAWMNTLRVQGLSRGEVLRPHIVIVGNLTPSTEDKPALLSFDDAEAIFHEFGHALHGLLSDVKYSSLASPQVYWDFVELPSQIMENWLKERETLELFAKHYETGEILPIEYIDKIKKTQTFNAGNMNNRQLTLGYLDMAWHTTDPAKITSVEEFEDKINEKTRLLPKTGGNTSAGFGHIFAGGYSSGYYSYKWAEVLDADAFELFKEKGIFNKDTANAFRKLLASGNSVNPMDLYREFRGKEPDVKAVLRRDGLI